MRSARRRRKQLDGVAKCRYYFGRLYDHSSAGLAMRRTSTIRRERKEPSPPAGGRAHSSAAEVRRLYAAYRANREPSDDEILQLIDRGLDATAIDELRAIGFSNVEIDDLAIPARTERHRRDREQKLTHPE